MAKRNSNRAVEAIQPPQISPDKGIVLVERQIEAGEKINAGSLIQDDDYRSWENTTENYLVKAFGLNHSNVEQFRDLGRVWAIPFGAGAEFWQEHYRNGLSSQLVRLRAYVGQLQTELELSPPATMGSVEVASVKQSSKKVFVVHGHNDAIREACARFLERLDLEPVILHEQPNAGRTIIEKFQDYADVGFAVVLLTADDTGGTKSSGPAAFQPRARQNVIFELGFFIGKLGRSKVCALYESGVELPSDYNGVLFTPLDAAGNWKFQLCREIKAAGIDVDLNKTL